MAGAGEGVDITVAFERGMFAEPGDDSGIFMEGLADALTTWASMNFQTDKPLSVRHASIAFNTTDAVIREAIGFGPWITFYGPDGDPLQQIIEVDGE